MTFEDLRREYADDRIGEGIYKIVRDLASRIGRRYPESIYNSGMAWDNQSFDDLCQEVITNQLLGQKQIDYIFEQATSTESVGRLLTMQVKRALSARHKKSPIDRLLVRISDLATAGQLEKAGDRSMEFYRPKGSRAQSTNLSVAQINACVKALSSIPRLASRLDSSRETMIYTREHLETLINTVFTVVTAVSARDVERIFGILLTPWCPATLVPIEDESIAPGHPAPDPMEEKEMITAANKFAENLSHRQRVVLVLKCQQIPDAQIASELKLSRPTVAKLKQEGLDRMKQFMRGLPEDHLRIFIGHFLKRCNSLLEEAAK